MLLSLTVQIFTNFVRQAKLSQNLCNADYGCCPRRHGACLAGRCGCPCGHVGKRVRDNICRDARAWCVREAIWVATLSSLRPVLQRRAIWVRREGEKVQRGTHNSAVGTSRLLQSGMLLTPSSLPSFRLCRSKVLSCRNKVLARIFIYASFYKCICVYASFCISMCTYLYTFFNVYAMMILCTDIYVFECIYVYMY